MPNLGGSPLGLIGIESRPTRDGMSTFNGGRSRNINVNLYNDGKETDKSKLQKSKVGKNGGMYSLFTGGNLIKAWANQSKKGSANGSLYKEEIGLEDDYTGTSRATLHNNDVYDTSVLNIVEKTAGTRARLRPSDFAYLKNLGVYPNNRLIIARRFSGPVGDNIFTNGGGPISTLISWRKPDEDFLDITFGEEWIDADADFTEILNNIGKDLLNMGNLGTVAGAAFGAVPMPGFTEILTRQIGVELGVFEDFDANQTLPAGEPNLVKEAKRRKTIPAGQAGSGLTCTLSVKMTCEYEQKFISGIDPTIVYLDILSNALRFGTSPAVDYGLTPGFAGKIKQWAANPQSLITDFISAIRKAITFAQGELKELISTTYKEAKDALKAEKKEALTEAEKEGETEEGEEDPGASIEKDYKKQEAELKKAEAKEKGFIDKFVKSFGKLSSEIFSSVIAKYREQIKGIANALSGAASTPWHVTIGNPLRPIFCAGDMYTTAVQITLGPTLAFNDLPASIKVDFTLTPAKSWGLTDIMAKFNTGHLRVVNVVKDFAASSPGDILNENLYTYEKKEEGKDSQTQNQGGGSGASNNEDKNAGDPSKTTTKENQSQDKINKDANSNTGSVTK
jgi:hypothetical protein